MVDSPARRGFYEGILESYEAGYSPTAIADAVGMSVVKVRQIIAEMRLARHQVCCVCHAPASTYLRGMTDEETVVDKGLYACPDHEFFISKGIVFGNGYIGIHVLPVKTEEEKSA